jgi:hypothetical protein
MYAIHFIYGYIAIIDQTSVPKTRRMSIAANVLFLRPNWSGVNMRLKTIFKMNGNATMRGISFLNAMKKTFPKEMVIKTYRNVHAGPKTQAGGDHVGFMSVEYQLYGLFIKCALF